MSIYERARDDLSRRKKKCHVTPCVLARRDGCYAAREILNRQAIKTSNLNKSQHSDNAINMPADTSKKTCQIHQLVSSVLRRIYQVWSWTFLITNPMYPLP